MSYKIVIVSSVRARDWKTLKSYVCDVIRLRVNSMVNDVPYVTAVLNAKWRKHAPNCKYLLRFATFTCTCDKVSILIFQTSDYDAPTHSDDFFVLFISLLEKWAINTHYKKGWYFANVYITDCWYHGQNSVALRAYRLHNLQCGMYLGLPRQKGKGSLGFYVMRFQEQNILPA